jgi:chromosomal replication initiator protein
LPTRPPQTIWETALGQLELQVTRPNFETWLRPTTALRLEGHHLIVGVPSDFALEWLRSRMAGIVNRTVSRLLDAEATVSFEVLGAAPASSRSTETERQPAARTGQSLVGNLDPKLTFDAFIVLKCNRVAYRAAKRAFSDDPYGLLVISGPAGSGKTHLLHAIGNAAREAGRALVALTGEAFVDRYASAVRAGQPHTFREAFGGCEFFLLDDLRFLASRVSSQEQFLLALDALRQRGCILVVTTDAPPEQIDGLSEKLMTRLRSAVVARLATPSATERLEFLQALAALHHRDIPPAVLSLIAEQPSASVRDLAGRLHQVIAYADLSGQPISPTLTHEALHTLSQPQTAPQSDDILDTICSRFSISRDQLAGRSRTRDITYPRHLAMYLLRELGSCSLTQIGHILGGRDHSTVLSGYARIKQERAALPQTQADLDQLELLLRQHSAA